MSRTKNATRNIISGLLNKLVKIVFPFAIRAITIQVLGAEYLGLNSLFISLLQMLNLTELGFSNAIIYNMYRPVARKDKKTVRALLYYYKKIYRIIGAVILVGGIAIAPVLPVVVNGHIPDDINLYAVYAVYLANTTLSYYLFAYKSAIIEAHQRNDILSNVRTMTSTLQYIMQIIVLYIYKNFYVYVIIECIATAITNLLISRVADKKYPEYFCDGEISSKEKTDIHKRVLGLMVQKVCGATRNSLDSIFISAMFGLSMVAIYSNYYTIMTAVISVMAIITTSITSSIGNSIVTESENKNYHDMTKFNFIYMLLSGWLTVCLLCLYQPFMEMWMGHQNLLPISSVVLFCIYFYGLKMGDIRAVYSDAKGLWYENRYRAIAESIANIILNLILGMIFGVNGIIAGTLISLLVINFGYGSQILFKHYFAHQKTAKYYLAHGVYAVSTTIACATSYSVCTSINLNGIIGLLAKSAVCIIIPGIVYFVIYKNTKQYAQSKEFIIRILKTYKQQ